MPMVAFDLQRMTSY